MVTILYIAYSTVNLDSSEVTTGDIFGVNFDTVTGAEHSVCLRAQPTGSIGSQIADFTETHLKGQLR